MPVLEVNLQLRSDRGAVHFQETQRDYKNANFAKLLNPQFWGRFEETLGNCLSVECSADYDSLVVPVNIKLKRAKDLASPLDMFTDGL